MRSEKEYQGHTARSLTCGQNYAIIVQRFAGHEILVPTVYRCKSRFCPTCSKIRRAELIRKFKYFRDCGRCVKLELTFAGDSPNPYNHPEYYSHAWDVFLKRIRRRFPKIRFLRIVELHKSGIPHFHILIDHYISHTWITHTFPECGGGMVNWIKLIDPGRAINYVLKYVTKGSVADLDLDRFFYMTGMRQFSTSKSLFVFVPRNHTLYSLDDECSNKFRSLYDKDPRIIRDRFFCINNRSTGPPGACVSLSEIYSLISTFAMHNDDDLLRDIYLSRFDHDSDEARSKYPIFN
jgi:hypothetical protein